MRLVSRVYQPVNPTSKSVATEDVIEARFAGKTKCADVSNESIDERMMNTMDATAVANRIRIINSEELKPISDFLLELLDILTTC
ncbi:hypothetical protein [Haladaptatus salinisoli]|uniref:hypothetical protein n=1 Tax=Haladaptatus salinisoli TaxID=2884876 RepID=UPI001D0BD5EE|nr:hypothetical protein [Haladaptatus salinisoli]